MTDNKATRDAIRKALKASGPKRGRQAVLAFLRGLPESEPCDGKHGENPGWRRLTPKRLVTLVEEDMVPLRRDMTNHYTSGIGDEKRRRLLKALRIYAEHGVELPIWGKLAQIVGWANGTSVTHHIRALHFDKYITYVNSDQMISVVFPDGKATKPRCWNPSKVNVND